MNENLHLLGSESSVIYYNLNKQFSTLKRLIITKDYLFEEFKEGEFKESIEKLSQSQIYLPVYGMNLFRVMTIQ